MPCDRNTESLILIKAITIQTPKSETRSQKALLPSLETLTNKIFLPWGEVRRKLSGVPKFSHPIYPRRTRKVIPTFVLPPRNVWRTTCAGNNRRWVAVRIQLGLKGKLRSLRFYKHVYPHKICELVRLWRRVFGASRII